MDGDRRGTAALRHHSAAAAYGQRRRPDAWNTNGSARNLAARRKDARPPTSYGGHFGSTGGLEGRTPDRLTGTPVHGGLTRQASAPSLGRPPAGSPEASFDTLGRGSPQHHASLEASFARTQALRRANSASGLHAGSRGGTLAHGSSTNLRPGLSATAPRRRPYESTPLRGENNRSVDSYGSWRPSPSGYGGGHAPGARPAGSQFRSDALQLESRLTQLLHEHSLSSEGNRRGGGAGRRHGYGPKPGAEDGYAYGSAPFSMSTTAPVDSRYSTPGSHIDRRRGASPAGSTDLLGRSPASSLAARRSAGLPGSDPYGRRHGAHSRHGFSTTMDDSSMPETRLKIYSDLFEEVIERDRVFGSLLRKIKTAYDSLVRIPDVQPQAVPPMPGGCGVGGARSLESNHYLEQRSHSNEPTTRNEACEMQRENHVLKDLVERLHLELEEAIRREQRWKQKAANVKQRTDDDRGFELADGSIGQAPGSFYDDWKQHHQDPHGMSGDPASKVVPPSHALQQVPDDGPVLFGAGAKDLPPLLSVSGPGGPQGGPPRFHGSRREPSMSEGEQQLLLNQGGLLSVSSISAQTSPPPPPDPHGNAGDESARSSDSGMLPQRPERLIVVRPTMVPSLDLSRLQMQLEEDEYDDYDAGGEMAVGMHEDGAYDEQLYQQGVYPQQQQELRNEELPYDGEATDEECEEGYDGTPGGPRQQYAGELGSLGDPSDLLEDDH